MLKKHRLFKGLFKRKRFQNIIYRLFNRDNTAFLPPKFFFIREEIKKQFKCVVYPQTFTPIRKIGIINKKDYYVLIDCGDGIRDNLKIDEYCGKLYKFIFSTKKSKKNFVYFKVNYSPSKSKNIEKMAAEYDGIVAQCMPWSGYAKSYSYFFKNRYFLRKKVLKTPKKYDIVFFGSLRDYYYPAPYKDKIFKYPISVYEAKFFYQDYVVSENLKRFFLLKPSRKEYWEDIMSGLKNNDRTVFSPPVPFNVYLSNILRTNFNFCPPGVGQIIHKVYENMAIGLPSIIPESSYTFPSPLNINDIGIVYNGKKDFINKYFEFVNESRFREVMKNCVRIYEKYLTPKAIVEDMINKINDIF